MSHDAKSASRFAAPRTAAEVLLHINLLAQSDPTILQQELLPRLEAPQGDQSEKALREFIQTVDNMCEHARVLELYLNRISQVAGEKLDKFSPMEVGCAEYYKVKAEQEAEYKESLPDAMARLERFLKPQPAPAAEDAQAAGSSHDIPEPPSKRLRMDRT